ncbi:MAG TPA: serine hydrolase domain-containing protein [Nannocystaceae bacterium]|nr:serine hydrolase domain-containing protein [Nannocystaceae bacterium]
MRRASLVLLTVLAACPKKSTTDPRPPTDGKVDDTAKPDDAKPVAKRKLDADTPSTTVAGNGFIAPAGWTIAVDGRATILESPEGDSKVAFFDVQAKDAEAAVKDAWAAFDPKMKWKLLVKNESPDHDGWSRITSFAYEVPPNLARSIGAQALFANGTWTVVLIDVADATAERRGSQLGVLFGRLLPKGGAVESFAGKQAHPLDEARIAVLSKFITDAQALLEVEGVGLGLIDDGKVVFAGGFGVRALGKPAKVDADTRFIVASNTKALTTLMLAKLVDEKALGWDTVAKELLPTFALGDAATTGRVQVKHLICACTGMPRQDLEWLLEYGALTPERAMQALAGMQPTTGFGELFQYSNVMAAAAGFIGGHVAYPKLELGKAYDKAMKTRVFDPLGMKSTTFDFKKAMTGNFAMPHSFDVDLKPAIGGKEIDASVIPVRPAGGAWSTVDDMLAYVQMELAEGALPDGTRYISKESLLARRAPQVAVSNDTTYGMGLMVNTRHGIEVISHGGDIPGFHSDMMWIPSAGVGAVILTNSDRGATIRSLFKRKLLEVLYDGKPEADAALAQGEKNFKEAYAVQRAQLVVPADAAVADALAKKYVNDALGSIAVIRKGTSVVLDFGEWKSEVASRKNPDGTISLLTIAPGVVGFELVIGTGSDKTLVLRDAQHEYVFTAA